VSGFFLLHRGWRSNAVFQDEPCTEREAWVWIIEETAYQDRRLRIGKVMVSVQRGQLAVSTRFLSEAWGWHHSKVRRFLNRLENERMIDTHTDTGVTLITVCNYEKYQAPDFTSDTDVGTAPTQQRHSSDTKQKKENKENKGDGSDLSVEAPDQPSESGLAVGQAANDNPPQKAAKQKKGTRVPDGDLPEEWAVEANHSREKHGLPLLGRRTLGMRWSAFQDYWRGVAGSKGLKADWLATWRNDCINPLTDKRFPATAPPANGNSQPQTGKRWTVKDLKALPDFFDGPTDI